VRVLARVEGRVQGEGSRPALQQDAYRDEYGSPVRSIQVGALTQHADAPERELHPELGDARVTAADVTGLGLVGPEPRVIPSSMALLRAEVYPAWARPHEARCPGAWNYQRKMIIMMSAASGGIGAARRKAIYESKDYASLGSKEYTTNDMIRDNNVVVRILDGKDEELIK
jgi:hypothetical protein